jgi:WD40 repeat protein
VIQKILDPKSNYVVQARIPALPDFKLQSLRWASHHNEARLFGISLKGFLFEVDFESLTICNVEDVYGGTAWCLAESPREPVLAVGGEQGIVRLFRYYSSISSSSGGKGRLEYIKSITTSGSRIVSIAYHPGETEKRLFLGSDDGAIRCVDEVSLSLLLC